MATKTKTRKAEAEQAASEEQVTGAAAATPEAAQIPASDGRAEGQAAASAAEATAEPDEIEDEAGELLRVNPNKLIIGENVRKNVKFEDGFVENIGERGVRVAINAWRNEEGQLVVDDGQKRTLAAVLTGLTRVPVQVVDKPGTDADRILDQLNVNRHRGGITAADEAVAYQQLALEGMNAGQIAKKASVGKDEVEAGLRLAKSNRVSAVVTEYPQLGIVELAVLAEFDDDATAMTKLADAAQEGQLEHKAQELRNHRIAQAFKASLLAELEVAAIPVITAPSYYGDKNTAAVPDLKDRHGNKIDPAEHAKCPGHSAYLNERYSKETPYEIRYACRDLKAYGHYRLNDAKLRKQDMTPDQIAAASVARRDVIDSNRAWLAAEEVRRTWLKTLLARKNTPKGTATFVAESLFNAGYQITSDLTKGLDLAAELLGVGKLYVPASRNPAFTGLLKNASDQRTQMITLGMILCAYEASTNKNSWRSGNDDLGRYLRFLGENGYSLAPVERRAAQLEALPEEATDDPGGDDLGEDGTEDLDSE